MNRKRLFKLIGLAILAVGVFILFRTNEDISENAINSKRNLEENFYSQNKDPDEESNVVFLINRRASLTFTKPSIIGQVQKVDAIGHIKDEGKPSIPFHPSPIHLPKDQKESLKGGTVERVVREVIPLSQNAYTNSNFAPIYQSIPQPTGNAAHLCVVVCGKRTEEALAMLKSVAMVTSVDSLPVVVHIVTEPALQKFFRDHLEFWPAEYRKALHYNIYNVSFPSGKETESWRQLFRPCASQRLFFPDLLQSLDSMIYVDVDVLFFRPVTDLWAHFSRFNSSQLAALVPEGEDPVTSWYRRFAEHPFYGEMGLNSGVMLMNLTRMRQSTWREEIPKYFEKYRLIIPWGDQDLINVYFAAHPGQLYVLPCEWNYRAEHCMRKPYCLKAEEEGISLLHGSMRKFNIESEPSFGTIYQAFRDLQLGVNFEFHFLKNLEEKMHNLKPTKCGHNVDRFLVNLRKLIPSEGERAAVGNKEFRIQESSQNKVKPEQSKLVKLDSKVEPSPGRHSNLNRHQAAAIQGQGVRSGAHISNANVQENKRQPISNHKGKVEPVVPKQKLKENPFLKNRNLPSVQEYTDYDADEEEESS